MAILKSRDIEVKRLTDFSALYRAYFILLFIVAFSFPAQAENKSKNEAVTAPITLKIGFSDGDPPTSWARDSITARGVLPELASAVFKRIDHIHMDAMPLPWPRAKLMAEQAQIDGLLTYPSKSRQEYLLFSDLPTYAMDYSYVIFNVDNPKAAKLARIKNYEELGNYLMATEGPETTDSWEEENLPLDDFPRVYVNKAKEMFHLVLLRNSADYFLRNLEEAKYIAKILGYSDQLGYVKVEFKTKNVIPFHLGVHKSHPNAEYIIEQINAVQRSPEFEQKALRIIKHYQHHAH